MILSVSGLMGAGKDTVSNLLVSQHGFKKDSFAASLKDAVAVIFRWDRDMLEGITDESRAWREQVDEWWAKRLDKPHLTPRWVLQNFSTEVCRKHFHDELWIASLEKKLAQNTNRNIVITDARFKKELDMAVRARAKTIAVFRGELPDWWSQARRAYEGTTALENMIHSGIHSSEWDWATHSFDYVINNNGTLDDLADQVRKIVSS